MTLVNQTISHYKIVSLLGAGGMGEVYLAQDTKLDRKVALKILPAEFAADSQRMRRFVQEAKAASALNHPNILTIHEIEQTEAARFIATEFIDGETLRQHLNASHMRIAEALDVSVQIASALSAAHAAGIIHRDIKPENVMIRRDGIVKVLDFGLAKLIADQSTSVDTQAATKALLKTDPGKIVGTAAYMSPEQARGMPVDARTDIFSIGIVLYEMVAACLPFEGSTKSEVLASILSEKEPQPLARYSREVPAELERIVSKALRKNREQRYQTTKDLLLDLQSLKQQLDFDAKLEHSRPPKLQIADAVASKLGAVATITEPIRISTSTPWRLTAALKLRRGGVILTAGVLVALLAALALVYAWQRRVNLAAAQAPIRSLAVLPLDNLSGDASQDYFAEGMTEELNTELAKIGTLRVISRSSTMQYKGTRKTIPEIAGELNVDAIVEGSVLRSGDKVRINAQLFRAATEQNVWAGNYERDLRDVLSLQDEVARGIVNEIRIKLTPLEEAGLSRARPIDPEAQEAYLKGVYYFNQAINGVNGDRLEEETPLYEKSFEYFQQAIKIEPNYAQAYAALAGSYENLASSGGPPGFFPKAKEAALKALQLDETNATAHGALAWVILGERDWVGAEKEFKRAGETGHHGYAHLLSWEGRHEEAIREITLAEQLDPLVFDIKVSMGAIFIEARQYDRAIEKFKSILELNPNYIEAKSALAWAYAYKGMYDDAIAEELKYIELTNGHPAKNLDLAWDYAMAGRRGDAVRILDEVTKSDPDPHKPRFRWKIAKVYAALNEKELALSLLDQVVAERKGGLDLKVSPDWDNLRSDPRFQDLLRRVGLPQ